MKGRGEKKQGSVCRENKKKKKKKRNIHKGLGGELSLKEGIHLLRRVTNLQCRVNESLITLGGGGGGGGG